ncbi:N-6 DNA methylase, partial [bacterium]|nr:N-6 DNA methylase [bacterium]
MIPETVRELCERYERNERSYRSDDYNEARLRQEFLNPFFKALGWDMENEQGWAEAYKDVVHEDSIDVAGHRKAPDYSFGIGKDRKFYVEAKKPLISVNDSKDAAFQLRSYAWSSKFSLSILTNFAEFAVYDCRFKPDMKDKPGLHRINYFKHTDYLEQWDLIASVFSRDAILKGSFDKYALEGKGKRGTEPVYEEFLKEIEEWRKVLARNINLRNPNTSLEDLNFAVGKIIDRLLFLRICEDRKIEEYEQIGKLRSGVGAYMKMIGLFKQADDWYNAGLFHFNPQHKRAEGPDLLTPKLIVDDKILKGIIDTLYLPKSPYKFEKFPADILGQVYEQFLGKVIVKKGRTVDPVEKPEVKKAGGVYYTPTYIVEYIVEHTVGKLVDGKTPDEVAKLKVLDPACGSGSFLIGAYQHLLDWHQTYYEKQIKAGEKASKLPVYESVTGKWKLTLPERKRILLNNIYGVDIDAQAVEVTKLSLLLKVLEGENRASVQGEVKQHHAALPDLGNNIKCGNSLVAPDINTVLESSRKRKRTPPTPPAIRGGELREYPVNGGESELTEEEWHKINPFDWQT